jgi:hypothetical protein
MADVADTLAEWSSTTDSNSPSGATNIGTGLDNNLREIQGVVVRGLSHKGSDIASSTTPALGATEGLYHDITGTATITGWDTVRAGLLKIVKFEGILTLTHNSTNLILLTGANRITAVGDVGIYMSEGSGNWREIGYSKAGVPGPTVQVFTTGSGTYTTPSNAKKLRVRMVGGGGGGGARNTNDGANGGDTTFSTLTASGGVGGGNGGGAGGTGGTGTNGDANISGGSGTDGVVNSVANIFPVGGAGGNSFFGGAGGGRGQDNNGRAAGTNSGSGGGGGGGTTTSNSGAGGGAGGYVEKTIASPAATYSYAVGAGGAGGAAGSTAGGDGAAGIIIVEEFYN